MTLQKLLEAHQRVAFGMTNDSPDTCTCGARIKPLPGTDNEITQRRRSAFAAHQAAQIHAVPLAAEFGTPVIPNASDASTTTRFFQRQITRIVDGIHKIAEDALSEVRPNKSHVATATNMINIIQQGFGHLPFETLLTAAVEADDTKEAQ